MIPAKIISPDFKIGKTLVFIRTLFDIFILLITKPSIDNLKIAIIILKLKPKFTMVSNENLIKLKQSIDSINSKNIVGDIVECGVWNGGSAALMAITDQNNSKAHRNMWLFDSFEGLPPPNKNDKKYERNNYFKGWNKGSINKVKEAFQKLDLDTSKVKFKKGFFSESLKNTDDIKEIALLHIDSDWYDSVIIVLEKFYDKVSIGGIIIFDDFNAWKGCNRAINDFFSKRSIDKSEIYENKRHGAMFIKK